MAVGTVLGAILAGGQSRRMGGADKALKNLSGRTLLERVISRARPQVSELVLNANGDPTRFAATGLLVLPDVVEGFAGPLAGILTVLEWANAERPETNWVATFPADAPFVPLDYVSGLLAAIEQKNSDMACAASGGRTHPVCGLWDVQHAAELRVALVDENIRKIDVWTGGYRLAEAIFEIGGMDPFFNINRPEDLAVANRWAIANE